MKTVLVKIKMGTAAKKIPSTTAGLTSGYQRTNITTTGTSVLETTGGFMIPELMVLPWNEPLSFLQRRCNETSQEDPEDVTYEKMRDGYRSMTHENSQLAEECLPVGMEVWPDWE